MKKLSIREYQWPRLTISFLLATFPASVLMAHADTIKDARSIGPSSVASDLEKAETAREKAPWPTIPKLNEYDLKLAADYQFLYQRLSSSPPGSEDDALGGVARLYGTWEPIESGRLVFKAEHRHHMDGYIAPNALQAQAGIAGVSGPTFSSKNAVLTNLYWGQSFSDNKLSYIAGIIDVSDYFDVYGLANVWIDFNNLAFSTNPTAPVPAQGLGAAGRWASPSNFYVLGSIADANGDPHTPEDAFESFFSTSEYFSHVEIGRVASWGR